MHLRFRALLLASVVGSSESRIAAMPQSPVRFPHDLVTVDHTRFGLGQFGTYLEWIGPHLVVTSPMNSTSCSGSGSIYEIELNGSDLELAQRVGSPFSCTSMGGANFGSNVIGDDQEVFVAAPLLSGSLGLFEGRLSLMGWNASGVLEHTGVLAPTIYKPLWGQGLALTQDELFLTANGNRPLLEIYSRPLTPQSPPAYSWTTPPGVGGGRFGDGIAVHNEWLAVGHPQGALIVQTALFNSGRLELFRRDTQGTWSHHSTLVASPQHAEALFGQSVAFSPDGRSLFVGEPGWDVSTSAPRGRVHRFELDASGNAWVHRERWSWSHTSGPVRDFFGWSLLVEADRFFVGAPGGIIPGVGNGAVVLFERSGATFVERQTFSAQSNESLSLLGNSFALDGESLLVGAPFEAEQDGVVVLYLPTLGTTHCAQPGTLGPTLEAAGSRTDPSLGVRFFLRRPASATGAMGVLVGLSAANPPVIVGAAGQTMCLGGPRRRLRADDSFLTGPVATARFSLETHLHAALAGATLYAQGYSLDTGGALALTNMVEVP